MSNYCDGSNSLEFHIPECHINLVINSWLHHINKEDDQPSRIGSQITDVIVQYVYTLPKLLFRLTRRISRQSSSSVSIPTISAFNKKYITIKSFNSTPGFFGDSRMIKAIPYPNKVYISKTINYSSFLLSCKKQYKSLKRIISDNIHTISKINHPNIVKIKELYQTKQQSLTYVSPHYKGDNLLQGITNGNREWTEYDISIIMEQILQGLYFMQKTANMNHGQLNPAKILFTDKNVLNIKINGFGFGKMMSSLSKTKHFNNLIYYKSPEMIKNKKYTYKSDLYAVGIIMFLLLFGYNPFTNLNMNDYVISFGKYETKSVSEKIKKGFVNKVRNTQKYGNGPWFPNHIKCSNEARDFIANLLSHKIKRRYSAKTALSHPFITMRKKLQLHKYVISQNVIHSIKEYMNYFMFQTYIVKLFEDEYHNIKPQYFEQFEIKIKELNKVRMDFYEFINVAKLSIAGIQLDKRKIEQELTEIGISKRYDVACIELLSVLKDNYLINRNKKIHLMLQEKYDYYNTGFASVYRIKKLFAKYDTFNKYNYNLQIIQRQEIDRCGMINYEQLLTELHPNNGFPSKNEKKRNKNKKCRLKRLPSVLIIANGTFAK